MTNAAALYKAANEANAKLIRNQRTCEFISYTRREADPFVAYAPLLARLQKRADETRAAWVQAAEKLAQADLIKILTEAA